MGIFVRTSSVVDHDIATLARLIKDPVVLSVYLGESSKKQLNVLVMLCDNAESKLKSLFDRSPLFWR